MKAREETVVETNGIQLHVVQEGPKDGKVMLFLHGFPEFWYGWHKQIAYFAKQGYRVWAPDQRGYNLSDKPRKVREYTLDKLAADIAGLIKASGDETVILVGHDWGGIVAWRVARTYPQLIERLVILNAPHEMAMSQQMVKHPTQLLKSSYAGFFQLPRMPEKILSLSNWKLAEQMLLITSRKGTFLSEDLIQYRMAWSQPKAFRSMLNWYRAMLRSFSNQSVPEQVPVPTMIIWGEKDPFLGRYLALKSMEFCNEGRLVFFEQATHWVHLEEADKVNQLIEQFANDKAFLLGKLVSLP